MASSDVFIFNFERISHLVLVFLLLILSRQMLAGFVCDYYQFFFLFYVKMQTFQDQTVL